MKIDLSQKLIVATNRIGEFIHECKQYDLTGGEDMFVVVTAATDLAAALALPVDTPWCIVWASPGVGIEQTLTDVFGPPSTFAQALRMETDEIAIRPALLQRG